MENSPVVPEDAPRVARVLRSVLRTFLLLFGIVVLGIWLIAIIPCGKVMRSVKVKEAQKVAEEIAGAISSFNASYDRLPIDAPDADWAGTTGEMNGLVAVLTAAERPDGKVRNPKKINFLDGFKQAKRAGPGKWADGIDEESDPWEPAIYDPWGQPYLVIMDTNKDQVIANPLKLLENRILLFRGKKAVVYSTGPPKADGSRNTDESEFITSW